MYADTVQSHPILLGSQSRYMAPFQQFQVRTVGILMHTNVLLRTQSSSKPNTTSVDNVHSRDDTQTGR